MEANVTCQSCRQPLQLDPSLLGIQQSQYMLISSSLPNPPPPSPLSRLDRITQLHAPSSSKQAYLAVTSSPSPSSSRPSPHKPSRLTPADSFVLLPPSANLPSSSSSSTTPTTPSFASSSTANTPTNKEEKPTKQTLITSLLELVSSRTDTDHPLCSECARLLQEVLKERLEDVKRERDGYIAFERKFKGAENGGRKGEEEVEGLRRRVEELKQTHLSSLSSLLTSESNLSTLQTQLSSLETQSSDLASQELLFLTQHNTLARKHDEVLGLKNSERTQYALELRELERLEGVNVWSEVFCIGVSSSSAAGGGGRMGNIGGLRLGKGGGRGGVGGMVDWPEINAAWGLTIFCLQSIARRVEFTFETYRLVPLGSFSRIEDVDGKNSYELHGSSDLVSRFLQNRRFETAMVAFLECLRQLVEFARQEELAKGTAAGNKFAASLGKYRITKDKIGEPNREVSIKVGYAPSSALSSSSSSSSSSTGEEGWTRACRYMLQTLHLLVEWSSRREKERVGGGK
ncbi:autophagy protein Apg6-domain-containing protein [Mrakia frigida]|uniref:beclin 1 n=1 Tax=Mrakia frigida TaxID=29902 RepID=UPI003FCC0779